MPPNCKDFVLDVDPRPDTKPKPKDKVTTAMEMEYAEHNFDVILRTLAGFSRYLHIDATELKELIHDLKATFALVRRSMNENPRCKNYPGAKRVAERNERLPQKMQKDAYDCLCPLTVFLRLIAQSFNHIGVRVRDNNWGTITPLRNLLIRMEQSFEPRNRPVENRPTGSSPTDYRPGFAKCIMFHEKNSRFIVTSSAARYDRLTGVQQYTRAIRQRYIDEIKRKLPSQREAIESMEAYSGGIKQQFIALNNRGADLAELPGMLETFTPHKVDGCNATFTSNGEYLAACMMDYLRFQMNFPKAACEKERGFAIKDRTAYQVGSCAEWELYITILYKPDPSHPPSCMCKSAKPKENGMRKPNTWSKPAEPRPPQGAYFPPGLQKPKRWQSFTREPEPPHPAASQLVFADWEGRGQRAGPSYPQQRQYAAREYEAYPPRGQMAPATTVMRQPQYSSQMNPAHMYQMQSNAGRMPGQGMPYRPQTGSQPHPQHNQAHEYQRRPKQRGCCAWW